jgi:hemoglobin/transferrin/lactoferrin receptor protein
MSFLPILAALAAGLQTAVSPVSDQVARGAHERIVVTAVASRAAEAVDATPATVSVITREDLDRDLARDIRDALRYEPGLSVENAAARFGLGNISIRGLEGNRVQMLLDGVRMPDGFRIGSFSNASRNPYDLGLLSRIEVLRGPGSALYGSDALAGVVSMTTLAPRELMRKDAAFGGFADAGYASMDDSVSRAGALAARAGAVEILVGASRTDGHERENRGDVDSLGAMRTVPNPQDGFGASQLAKLVVPTRGGGHWGATFDRFERRVATDVKSLNPQSPRTVSLTGDDRAERRRASLDGVFFDVGFADRLGVIAYDQRSETLQDTTEVRANTTAACLSAPGNVSCRREAQFSFAQYEVGVTAIGQAAVGERHRLVFGAEWSRARAEEMRDGSQTNLNTGVTTNVVGTDVFPMRDFPKSRVERIGAFVQDEVALPFGSIIPALRFDRFEMEPRVDDVYAAANPGRTPVGLTDSAWSPKLGALVPLGAGVTLSLQAATGFRTPPYFDVNVGLSVMPQGYTVIANPDLESETSRGVEAGLRGRHGALDWSVTAYRTNYDDLIVSRVPLPCPGDPRCVPTAPITFQSQNVSRARIQGLEARAELRLARGWSAKLGAAAARGDDLGKAKPLNSVDPAKVVLGLAWEGVLPFDVPALFVTPAKAGAQLHVTHAARKSRIDSTAGTLFATPAYTVADLTGFVELGRNVTLSAGVFNAFDRKHWLWSDVRGAVNPGASIDRYTQPGRSVGVRVKYRF